MEPMKPELPLLLIVDPSTTLPPILKAILRRACQEMEIVSFQKTDQAIFWLSGAMDYRKATKYSLLSPWNAYPALKSPTIAIVSLDFPARQRDRMMALVCLQEPYPHLFTTSATKGHFICRNLKSWKYRKHIVSHIPIPVNVDEMLRCLVPFIQQ